MSQFSLAHFMLSVLDEIKYQNAEKSKQIRYRPFFEINSKPKYSKYIKYQKIVYQLTCAS